jgi:cell division protease FtsH
VHKVTILPRGRSLGHTLVLPTEDRYTQVRSEIIDQLVYALGGRAAEELVFHEPTTGASNDIEKATAMARAMITEYGMSSKLGAVKYGQRESEPFLGRDYGHQRDYSETVATDIDAEVRQLIELAHDEAWEILVEYRDVLDDLVLELMEKETLGKDELARIFAPVAKRPPHNTFAGFGRRAPSDKPPVMTPAELRAVSTGRGPANGAAPGMPSPGPRPAPTPAPAPAQYGANGPGRHATTPDGHPAQPGYGQPGYGQPGYGQPGYGTGQFAGGPGTPPTYPAQPHAAGPGTPPAHPAQPHAGGQQPQAPQPYPGQSHQGQPPYQGGQSGYGPEDPSYGSGDNGQAGGYGQGWTPGDGQPGSR